MEAQGFASDLEFDRTNFVIRAALPHSYVKLSLALLAYNLPFVEEWRRTYFISRT